MSAGNVQKTAVTSKSQTKRNLRRRGHDNMFQLCTTEKEFVAAIGRAGLRSAFVRLFAGKVAPAENSSWYEAPALKLKSVRSSLFTFLRLASGESQSGIWRNDMKSARCPLYTGCGANWTYASVMRHRKVLIDSMVAPSRLIKSENHWKELTVKCIASGCSTLCQYARFVAV